MKKTTQCYIENNGRYLMLYRNRKAEDMNEGKWVAVGGKAEAGETPDETNAREVYEETGIRLNCAVFHGIARFRNTKYEPEDMYLYSSDDFELPEELNQFTETEGCGGSACGPDKRIPCGEGDLAWVTREELLSLPMWEGDMAFLESVLDGETGLDITLYYDGDMLKEVTKTTGSR